MTEEVLAKKLHEAHVAYLEEPDKFNIESKISSWEQTSDWVRDVFKLMARVAMKELNYD